MEFFKGFIKRTKENTNDGFSLLELVVAIGILLVLTVTGLVSYNQIMTNARNARINNIATDLFMMGASNRMNGSGANGDTENLKNWADNNNMTFEEKTTSVCEVLSSTVEAEAMEISYAVDDRGNIKVKVENTSNNYVVERVEPGFNNSCNV